MLEGNSNNVINNSRFYKLLFDTNYLKKYKNMYLFRCFTIRNEIMIHQKL